MLTKISVSAMPIIKKSVNGTDASSQGAFAVGDIISFAVEVPRRLGASAVVLRIRKDGENYTDYPLTFTDTAEGTDIYLTDIDTKTLCGYSEYGLFFYEFLFIRGTDTLFTSTYNQVDFTLERHSE